MYNLLMNKEDVKHAVLELLEDDEIQKALSAFIYKTKQDLPPSGSNQSMEAWEHWLERIIT